MRTLPSRIIGVGIDPDDDADMRLRKFLLLIAALITTALAVVWGGIYWLAGAPSAAAVPWIYVGISLMSLAVYAATRNYGWFAITQFVPYVTFPFVLMWILGGFAHGSAVAIWAGLGPILALLLGHRWFAIVLASEYAVLTLASALVPAASLTDLPGWLEETFFVLNLAAVPLLAWLLVRLFVTGSEGALASVRDTVRKYFSPELATDLLANPDRSELGGEIVLVTILFADLGGFSTYAENRAPTEVVGLLNRYFAVAIPAILREGGSPTQLAGDAVMAVFGAPQAQADHAVRACRAASVILEGTAPLAAGPDAGPRFHIGVNSGQALVGNIGSEAYRNFTAIGDTTNVAARLQDVARPGEIVIGPETARLLDGRFPLAPLGSVSVKGRVQAVEAYLLGAA